MNIQERLFLDSGTPDFTFSIVKERYITDENGEAFSIGEQTRMAAMPGNLPQIISFIHGDSHVTDDKLHSIIIALKALWTDEVVDAYQKNLHLQ